MVNNGVRFEHIVRTQIFSNATSINFGCVYTSSIAADTEIQRFVKCNPMFNLADETNAPLGNTMPKLDHIQVHYPVSESLKKQISVRLKK